MKRLEGKVAVVTGGNSGIGLASAKRFLEEGAKVAISGRNEKTLAEAAKELGKDVVVIQADTANAEESEKFLSAVEKKLGKIDVLFINAGIAKFIPLEQTPESVFDEQFDINIRGAYFAIQKALHSRECGGAWTN
jgi:NAD(P)-dependent dehydrogenase (short-subunit alcohol dehydrogenase family)